MAITPTEGRNVVHFARKIIAERMIVERRLFETMRDNKQHEDVAHMGRTGLENFRAIMINVSSVDLLDVGLSAINVDVINLTEEQEILVNKLTRYMLLELDSDDWGRVRNQIALSIMNWSYSRNADDISTRFVLPSDGADEDDTPPKQDDQAELAAIDDMLLFNPQFVVLVLLADLHHLTYVASADQCSEILLSI